MKKITNYLLFFLLAGGFVFLNSCSEDDPAAPSAPTVTPPNSITVVKVTETADITFSVSVPGGYKAGGTAVVGSGSSTIKTDLAAGATSGSIVVEYQAGDSEGAASVALSVTDNSNQTVTGNAAVSVTEDDPPPANEVLNGVIEEDLTITSDRIWELAGRVIIDSLVTVTIEPGSIIKGRPGQESSASALIVARGGKLMAEGTADNPIVFTSTEDNIAVGEKMGTNLAKEDNEKWGGLIVLGAAPISAGEGDTEASIEGLPANEQYGKYGGTIPDDNSGTIKYISVRHGGITIGAGNEINGITLGGVGSGTTIDQVEVYATLDDGIEFFGGTVDVSNALVAWQGDDGVDIDQNYSGTVDNFIVTHGVGVETDEGLEIDGPEGTTYTDGLFTLVNGTIMNDGQEGSAGDFKSKAQGTVQNVVFTGYSSAKIKIRASYTNDCMDPKTDAFTHLTQASPTLVFTNTDFDTNEVYTSSKTDDESADCTVSTADQDAADAKMVPDDTATGADDSVFGWTAAAADGLL